VLGFTHSILKTENTCAIGNLVETSSVASGAPGNVQCFATVALTDIGKIIGVAASAGSGTQAAPVAIDVQVQPR